MMDAYADYQKYLQIQYEFENQNHFDLLKYIKIKSLGLVIIFDIKKVILKKI